MTKDWDRYEAEIKRLYVSESNTLEEVQRLLKRQGFDASIRAYRMKLDSWGVRKNASTHVRKKRRITGPDKPASESSSGHAHTFAKSLAASPASLHGQGSEEVNAPTLSTPGLQLESPPAALSDFEARLQRALLDYNFVLPVGNLKVQELMRLLSTSCAEDVRDYFTLELLLAKWQSDGTYLKAALDLLPDYNGAFLTGFCGGNVFQVIDEKVGLHEQRVLIKACLECVPAASDIYDEIWPGLILDAMESQSWTEVKSNLNDNCLRQEVVGKSFFSCALLTIGERFLSSYMIRLKTLLGDDHLQSDGVREATINDLRAHYMEVLEDFSDAAPEFDLDRSWYKFALQLSKWREKRTKELLEEIEQLKNSRHDSQAEGEHSKVQQVAWSHGRENLSEKSETLSHETTTLDSDSLMDKEPSAAAEIGVPSISAAASIQRNLRISIQKNFRRDETRRIFKDLLQTWQNKQDLCAKIQEHNLIFLTLDSKDVPIDERLGPNRLFDLIMFDVPSPDRSACRQAILQAFGVWLQCSMLTYGPMPALEVHWNRLYTAKNWDTYQYHLTELNIPFLRNKNVNMIIFQDKNLSKTTWRTILDYTTILVGTRLLDELKVQRVTWALDPYSPFYANLQHQYTVIEKAIRDLPEAGESEWVSLVDDST
ncbi:hypothetical protein EG329_002880 [Mollisiaceae sp. DMI_Dod_QoI]|nr:hypothetical protein EG329_002880 [Helotiales sp. DMI_Dod_QoI]